MCQNRENTFTFALTHSIAISYTCPSRLILLTLTGTCFLRSQSQVFPQSFYIRYFINRYTRDRTCDLLLAVPCVLSKMPLILFQPPEHVMECFLLWDTENTLLSGRWEEQGNSSMRNEDTSVGNFGRGRLCLDLLLLFVVMNK